MQQKRQHRDLRTALQLLTLASASQLPGQVIAVYYNGTYYYYLRNAQNDVVKLIDGSGNAVIEYM